MQQAALLTQLANHGLSVHASLSWVDGIRLIVDASGVKAAEASLTVLGMEVNRVGEASAMITFIGSWKDPRLGSMTSAWTMWMWSTTTREESEFWSRGTT